MMTCGIEEHLTRQHVKVTHGIEEHLRWRVTSMRLVWKLSITFVLLRFRT